MGQDVAVERLAELSAECAATDTSGQAAEDGARYGAEGDANWPGDSADSCSGLPTSQGSTDTTRNTANGADGRADFHGVMEGSDFRGMTTGALQ